MKRFAALLVIGWVLVSCSPTKRAQRLMDKAYRLNPKLGDSAVVVVLDTIVVPGDTINREVVTTERDTVVFTKDRVVTRIIRNFDTLQVYTECPTDTIFREVQVKCPPQANVTTGPFGWAWWVWLIVGFVVGLCLFIVLRR